MTSRNLTTRLKRTINLTAKTAEWYSHLTVEELLTIVDAFACALPAGLKRDAVLGQVAMMAETKDIIMPLLEAMIEDGYRDALQKLAEQGFFIPWPQAQQVLGDPDDDDSGLAALLETGLAVIVAVDGQGGVAMPPCLHAHATTALGKDASPKSDDAPKPTVRATLERKVEKKTTKRSAAEVIEPPPPVPAAKAVVRRSGDAPVERAPIFVPDNLKPASAWGAPKPVTSVPAPRPAPAIFTPRPVSVAHRVVEPPKRDKPLKLRSEKPPRPPREKRPPPPPTPPRRATVQQGPDLSSLKETLQPTQVEWEVATRLWIMPDGTRQAIAVVVDTPYGRQQGVAAADHVDVAIANAVKDALAGKGMLPTVLRVETHTQKKVVKPMLDTLVVQVGRPCAATRKVANSHRPKGAKG